MYLVYCMRPCYMKRAELRGANTLLSLDKYPKRIKLGNKPAKAATFTVDFYWITSFKVHGRP